jgi:hypothetical protein
MAWRVHLTNGAIQNLQILPPGNGKQTLLVAWTQRDRASYFDLETGAYISEHKHTAVGRQSDKWAEFVGGLIAPNGTHLPVIRTAQFTMYITSDGKLRLYHMLNSTLLLELDGKEISLELKPKGELGALALDRVMGVIGALDTKGKLYLFQQHISVGTFDMKLVTDEDASPLLAISDGGSALFVSNGREIVLTDTGGKVKKRQAVHYLIGRMVCSPNGQHVMTSDPETGVIRVYNGEDLTPTHQRHAMDMLQDADELQLLADLPPWGAAPGSMAIDDKGNVAFNISGVVCVTALKRMDALPRRQPLL